MLLPGSPPEMGYAPPRHSYYEGKTGTPYHKAVGTEMKKTVRMDESTESTRRIVTVEQTSRVIKFGEESLQNANQQHQHQQQQERKQQQNFYTVPKPTRFVQGQFRESDYESDADSARIRAKWAPTDSETEEPRYRRVNAPTMSRSPIVTMPPSESENERSETERRRHSSYVQIKSDNEEYLRPGSPPQYGYTQGQKNLNKNANRK